MGRECLEQRMEKSDERVWFEDVRVVVLSVSSIERGHWFSRLSSFVLVSSVFILLCLAFCPKVSCSLSVDRNDTGNDSSCMPFPFLLSCYYWPTSPSTIHPPATK